MPPSGFYTGYLEKKHKCNWKCYLPNNNCKLRQIKPVPNLTRLLEESRLTNSLSRLRDVFKKKSSPCETDVNSNAEHIGGESIWGKIQRMSVSNCQNRMKGGRDGTRDVDKNLKAKRADPTNITMEYVISVNKGRFEDIFNNPKVIALFENKPILKPAPIYNSCLECFAISVCQALLACPPFVRYVKEKIAETKLDMHMKSLVAQFAAHSIPAAGSGDWPRVSISKLLNSIPGGFNGKCREDAEDWYRQLSKEFYDETFGQVSAYYKTVCHECGKCREINDKSPRVQLRCPDLEITAANIESMLAVTGNEIVTWEHDGCENTTCRETTRYEFPDVILVSVDTFQDGNRHIGKELEFFPTEDFSPISVNNDEPDIFHLGGVIYFRTFNCFRDESSGHYMARVYHHGNVFLADDNRIYEQNINRPTEPANSVPYFAFYYRQRRAGRF